MADTAISIGTKIVEYLVEPVLIRPLRPIFCFETIVEDFRHEREKLIFEKARVDNAVQEAKNKGCEVREHVTKWFEDVEAVTGDAQNLESELTDNKSCCFNTGWTYHYCFSKKVRENTDHIKKLCERAKSINEVAHPFDLRQHIGLPFFEDFVFSKSVEAALRTIMEKLVNGNTNKIGIYGMRGSGKTTLVEQVVKEAERHMIVERVFIVPFPQTREEVVIRRSIQGTIADFLNVKLEQESVEGRASRLHQRLTNGEKVLLILDDVCKALDLAEIGIPASGGCKVLFTSHDLQVCNSMQAHEDNIIMLGVWSEDEGWDLFKSVAGVGDVLRMHDVIKEVLQYCKGLPKVIVNVGRALRGKEPSQWEETLQQLKYDQFKNISDALHTEMEKLSLRKQRVKDQVEIAKANAQIIEKDVDKWLANVEIITNDAEKWERELNESISCFTGLDTLIINQKGARLITIAKNLFEDGTFDQVAHPAPIRQYMGLSSSEDFMVSQSMNSAFHQVMDALEKDGVNMIGLYGMGGIGKTTLAKYVCEEAKRSKIFNDVVLVTVSQTPDILNIQGEIADFFNLELKEKREIVRAGKLNQRLERKKILIILDDVWEKFDLAKIGIFGDECKGSKILLTTRRLHVCTSMRCQTKIELDLLSEAEAWEFFRKKADLPYDSKSNEVAKEIVGECGRLPIALATVGSALREKGINDLEQALKKLREFRLDEIPEVNGVDGKNAYKCLRVSYDYLKHSTSGEAQFLLLLCSLFPEDHEISMEDLTRCAFGMGLFKRADSVQDARGEVGVAVQCLIDSCLLLGTGKEGVVKIHDVVRDVALWIGGTESPERSVFVVRNRKDMCYLMGKESLKNCRAISLMSNNMSGITTKYELVCPNLEALLIFSGSTDLGLSDAFFKNTTRLKVLDVRSHGITGHSRYNCHFLVPESLRYLTDLRLVNLRNCRCSNSSLLGELKNLEILSVFGSSVDCAIEAVFKEMKKLKLLDLTNQVLLRKSRDYGPRRRKMSSNVIKELSNLEELYTCPVYYFGGGIMEESCNISELNSLLNLASLSILNVNWRSVPIDFCFPNLERYYIILTEDSNCLFLPRQSKLEIYDRVLLLEKYDRVLLLRQMEEVSQLKAFKNLFPTVEYLKLQYLRLGEGFKNIIPCLVNASKEGFLQNLKELDVEGSGRMEDEGSNRLEALFEFEGQDSKYELQHHLLQRLRLHYLLKLKHIWKGSRRFVSLCNLTHVAINECPTLKTIFSSVVCIAPSLQQLQALFISCCDDLEEVISASADPNDDFSSCFQNLRNLNVYKCRNLKAIFPMHVMMMPRPRFHLPKLEGIYLEGNDELEHVFDHQTVAETEQWPSLENLSVSGCPKLSSHFVADIQTQLQEKQLRSIQLEDLDVRGWPKLSSHFVANRQTQLQAPSQENQWRSIKLGNVQGVEKIMRNLELLTFDLTCLELDNLQDLKCVWSHAKNNICFSNLTQVRVSNCNSLKQLFMISIAPSLKQLQSLSVHDCKELEEIISNDNQVPEENASDDHTNMISIIFPKLHVLWLKDLPSLIKFCPAKYNLVFPSLERFGPISLRLEGCPQTITEFFRSQRVTLKKPQIMYQ